MAKSVSAAALWPQKQAEFKKRIQELIQKEADLELRVKGADPAAGAVLKFQLAELALDQMSYRIVLTELCRELTGVKSDTHMTDARKYCYRAITYLEDAVTNYVDVPYSEYEPKLLLLEKVDDAEKLRLVRKLGFSIDYLIDCLGENSKWKWSYIELKGRFAVIAKNMLNLKRYVAELDPRLPGYQERSIHMQLVKQMLPDVAEQYRHKYELTSQRIDDMKLAITYLSSYKRLVSITGESDNMDAIKRKMDVWHAKMEDDMKKAEKKK